MALEKLYERLQPALDQGRLSIYTRLKPIYVRFDDGTMKTSGQTSIPKAYGIIRHMKAKRIEASKVSYPDGSIMEIVIWQLPEPTAERPHGYKYRLNYSLADGTILCRYDNETRKGDHMHIIEMELPYKFSSLQQLIADFRADIIKHGGTL